MLSCKDPILSMKEMVFGTPLGIHAIGNLMQAISLKAKTSEVYTNHCVPATTTIVLKRAGIQPTNIMGATGHSNVGSSTSYTSEETYEECAIMSTILAKCRKGNNIQTVAHTTVSSEDNVQVLVLPI